MTSPDFREFQRRFFQALRDRPLDLMKEEDRRFYEPLHDDQHDPVSRLLDVIEFSEVESVQLVAGFRGTGKTTDFSRLEGKLWESGFHVIRVDLDEYVDMYSAVDIRDFLLILAGAISDRLTEEKLLGEREGARLNFWEQALKWLPEVKDASLKLGTVDIKLGLRGDAGLRGQLRQRLATRLGELIEQVHGHHRKVLEALKRRAGRDVKLVVILDSLEHLRGTGETADGVRRSVEELFLTHAPHMRLPDTHMVMSVPAFLFTQANNLDAQFGNGATRAWPAYRVRDRQERRTDVVDRIIRLVERRGDWRRVLPDQAALERLIVASGGHLRDLLNMLREALFLATDGVGADAAEKVTSSVRRAYLPIYKDEIELLGRIARRRDLQDIEVSEREQVLRFLDAGLLLCYLNDDFWYDVHPLVRDLVLNAQ